MKRRVVLLTLLLVLLAGCGSAPAMPTLPPKATASPTPFQAAPTATISPVTAWISPALPPSLVAAAQSLDSLGGRDLIWQEEPAGAMLRFEPEPDVPLTRWVYLPAAPLGTMAQEISLEELAQAHRGQGDWQLVADPASQATWSESWGQAGLEPHAVEGMLPYLESIEQPSLALLGFEDLELGWTVLAVDGQSALSADFVPEAYPLTVEYGLSGPPELIEAAAAALDWPATNRQQDQLTTVAITGVTALTRATAWSIDRQGIEWAVEEVAPVLASADITHISHEVAFTEACPPVNPSRDIMRFCGQPEQLEVLAAVGTDVIELTGNHVMDYGPEALLETLDLYDQSGWQTFGGGRNLEAAAQPAFVEHNGHSFAFLGCNSAGPTFAWATSNSPGALPCDLEAFYDEIASLRQQGYLPIVTFQWAESYRNWPLPQQAEAFRRAAQAGALVVSGSQAHRPQGFELSDNGFIHFGLGNLFFDQMWSLETRQEFIDLYHFYRGELINVELTTWLLEDYARVRPMDENERTELLSEIFSVSGY